MEINYGKNSQIQETSTIIPNANISSIISSRKYFSDKLNRFDRVNNEKTFDPNIEDKDGLISYVVAGIDEEIPQDILKLYKEIAPIMEGLAGIAISVVLEEAGTDDKKKHDPKYWKEPMLRVIEACGSGFSDTTKEYNQKIRGIEVATQFLQILINATVSAGKALDDFRSFLQKQGDTINAKITKGASSYNYASVSITHEFFKSQVGWIYSPKFKSYFTSFNKKTFDITTNCASYNQVDFDFKLHQMTGLFSVETWKNDSNFRKEIQELISDFSKVRISNSKNYFNDKFKKKN